MLQITSLDIVLTAVFGALLWRERRNGDVWRIGLAVVVLLVVIHWRFAVSRDWLADLSGWTVARLHSLI